MFWERGWPRRLAMPQQNRDGCSPEEGWTIQSSWHKDLEKVHQLQNYSPETEQYDGNQKFLCDSPSTATWTDHGPCAPAFFAHWAMPAMLTAYQDTTSFDARNFPYLSNIEAIGEGREATSYSAKD